MPSSPESKVIPRGAGGCERWELPSMAAHGAAGAAGRPTPITASQLEQLQREAYDEAFSRGREEGFATGQAEGRRAAEEEIRSRRECLDAALSVLARPFDDLDEAVEQGIVALAVAVARQLVRRELATDPGNVVGVVREGLAALPVAARDVRLHLNPEDVPLVREALGQPAAEIPWSITPDPRVSRGGCQVESATSRIDATVESRLASVVAQVMGGEREEDPPGDA